MDGEVVEKLVGTVDCKQRAVRAVRFNADGNYCLTCGSDKTIKLWNPHRAALIKTYSGHGYEVLDAQSSCDNSQICSCSLDKTVLLWDVASGKTTRKYRGHAGQVNCVRFNEEGSLILSGSLDGTIRVWDCRSRKMEPVQGSPGMEFLRSYALLMPTHTGIERFSFLRGSYSAHYKVMDEAKDSVTSLYVTDYEILSGSADCRVRRYDIRSGELCTDSTPSSVTCVSLSRDGQCILVSSLDDCLRLLDKDTGELLNEYKGHKNTTYKIDSVISSSDKQIMSGSEDGQIFVWDLVDGKLLNRLAHIEGKVVHSLSYHPTKCCLLSACENKMFIWQSKYGQTIT